MKISVTVSMSRSSASSMMPTWLLTIFVSFWRTFPTFLRSASGFFSMYPSVSSMRSDSGAKTIATSSIQAASFRMAGFATSNLSSSG